MLYVTVYVVMVVVVGEYWIFKGGNCLLMVWIIVLSILIVIKFSELACWFGSFTCC